MRNQISKSIWFRFENRFAKEKILAVEMPYIPFLCINGYYSKLYKRMKRALLFSCEANLVKGKHWFDSRKTNRTIFTFYNGFSIDIPHNATPTDMKIIFHYLEGLKMSLKA